MVGYTEVIRQAATRGVRSIRQIKINFRHKSSDGPPSPSQVAAGWSVLPPRTIRISPRKTRHAEKCRLVHTMALTGASQKSKRHCCDLTEQ
jgi:hypothetical protein